MGEAVAWEARREGRRNAPPVACADLRTPRCRVFHPPGGGTQLLTMTLETLVQGLTCSSCASAKASDPALQMPAKH